MITCFMQRRKHVFVYGEGTHGCTWEEYSKQENNCPDKGGRNQKESKEMLRNMADLTGRGYI